MQENLIIQFLKKHRFTVICYLPLAILHGLTTLLLPLVTGAFFDIYFKTSTGKSRLLELLGISLQTTQQFFIFFSAAIVVKAILAHTEKLMALTIADQFSFSLTESLFKAQMKWSPEKFGQKSFGKYLLRYSGDLSSCKNLLVKGWMGTIKHSFIFLSGVGLLLLINNRLTLQLLLTIVILAPFVWLASRQKKIVTALRNQKSDLLSFITDSFSSHERIAGSADEQAQTFKQFSQKQQKLIAVARPHRNKQSFIYGITSIMGYLLIIILLAWVVIIPGITVNASDILIYMLVLFTLLSTIRSLFRIPAVFQKGNISLKKARDIIYSEVSRKSTAPNRNITIMKAVSS